MRIYPKTDISLRATPSGHGATDQVLMQGRAKTIRNRYVFLVHGYNTYESEALEGYSEFRRNLKTFSIALSGNIMTVSWSGHFNFLEGGPLRYRAAMDYADYSAKLLCDHLKMLSSLTKGNAHFIFIGHSMGCRMILKTLDHFYSSKQYRESILVDVVLMAAAVRASAVENGGELLAAATKPRKRAVLYSEYDSVLDNYFPKGEKGLSALNPIDTARKPEAVGLNGKPVALDRPWTVRKRMPRFGHGDYWGSKAAAAVVARVVHTNAPKEIEDRLIKERMALESRNLAAMPRPPFWM